MDCYVAFYFIFVLSSICFFIDVEALIGEKVRFARNGEFPYVVSIGWKNSERSAQQNHFCTGTLISRIHVLTAAHCVESKVSTDIRVTFGTIDLLAESNNSDVFQWLTYNQWASWTNNILEFPINDIAIMELSNPISNIEPFIITSLNNRQVERTDGIVAGFGKLDNGTTTRILQVADVKILSRDACDAKIRTYTTVKLNVPRKQLCSSAIPYVLTTCGDSGGPVINANGELVGVILGTCPNRSWSRVVPDSDNFFKKHKINMHASVDFYRGFIEYFIQKRPGQPVVIAMK